MEKFKLKKFVQELKSIRGRHTELVSVYIPAGYDLNKIISHLAQEQGTASNIKDKITRTNVIDSLERMIRHLRLFKQTPLNGLAAFAGNTASQEGKQDIKVWSIEPPQALNIRIYRCDQTFVTEPLEDMLESKDVYGLIVMDNREGTIGLVKGKSINMIKDMTSGVPGKTRAGGQCLDPETLIINFENKQKKLKEIKKSDLLKCYDFKNKEFASGKCVNVWTSKKKPLLIKAGDLEITSSYDHSFFVFKNKIIDEVPAEELKVGDFLVSENLDKIRIQEIDSYSHEIEMIDIESSFGNFLANGFLVHNSSVRFARLREIAAGEFYDRIAEIANQEFLAMGKNLKGILLGGPGQTKETFLNGNYLNNELKKKVIAIRNLSYTGEFGLKELVEKSQDALAQEEIIKEKKIMQDFFRLLATSSDKAVYGKKDVEKALTLGAADKILISEEFQNPEPIEEQAQASGATVIYVSTETEEGAQLRDLGGIAAFLRYSIEHM